MLLVLAALLAAGDPVASPADDAPPVAAPEAFVAEPPAVETSAADGPSQDAGEAAADPEASSAPRTAEFSLNAAAGTRGERRAEAIARASGSGLSLTLGAIDFGGISAPERQEILLGAQAGVIRGELRLVPQSAGLFRAGAELGFHFETVGLVLSARTASLGRMQLRGAGARLELEAGLAEGVHGGLSASAWALQLDAPAMRHAWLSYGLSTLDWAQRWETGAWLSIDFGDLFALTPSLSAAQPAQPNTFEARASLALEVPLGPIKLRAESAVARQWPEMWLADLSLGVAMSVY
jgi:hypothetical protein